jgi:hypothetical protein
LKDGNGCNTDRMTIDGDTTLTLASGFRSSRDDVAPFSYIPGNFLPRPGCEFSCSAPRKDKLQRFASSGPRCDVHRFTCDVYGYDSERKALEGYLVETDIL